MKLFNVLPWLIVLVSLRLDAQTASLLVPQQSAYGYPWSVLAGSDRVAYVTPIAETDPITAWSGDGTTEAKAS